MKKKLIAVLCILSLLLLAGCKQQKPTTTKDGEPWSEDWIQVGNTLGIEPPGNGLTLLDNKDVLSASDLYYAAWTIGEQSKYVNSDNETVDLYDAQLYLLLQNCGSADKAASRVTEWQSAETEIYQITETLTVTCAGQEFTILLYQVDRESNPYARGASAFGVYGTHAINAELTCVESFDGDLLNILTEFLEGIHYA